MAVEVRAHAKLPTAGALAGLEDPTEIFGHVIKVLGKLLPEELRESVLAVDGEDEALNVWLHPAEAPVLFELKDGELACNAQTVAAGPGYHAFVVEALDALAQAYGLDWCWDQVEGQQTELFGYRHGGDYTALQRGMAAWLQALAQELLRSEETGGLGICLPPDYRIVSEHFAASPLGFWDREWFERTASCDAEGLEQRARRFFPWWEQGFGADFWFKCGLTRAWLTVPWRSCNDEDEEQECRFVLDCFGKARQLDPTLKLPVNEIAQLEAVLKADDLTPPPDAEGIGFRRRMMRRGLPGAWTVELPGYWFDDLEDEDSTAVYWYADRTFRASAFVVEEQPGAPPTAAGLIGDADTDSEFIEFEREHLRGRAQIEQVEEDGELYWCLYGETAAHGNFCQVTISYQAEGDRDWALRTWRSVSMPDPRAA
jgi:hypothetical protein